MEEVVPYEADLDYETLETNPIEDEIIKATTHHDHQKMLEILSSADMTERIAKLVFNYIETDGTNVPPAERESMLTYTKPFWKVYTAVNYAEVLKTVHVSSTQVLPEPLDTQVVPPSSESDLSHTQDVSLSRLSPPPESHSSLGHLTA
jgi:hypothetical protein